MWAGTEFGHRPQISSFRGCELIESDTEKALIECGDRKLRRGANVFDINRAVVSHVP